ncbi:MAG: decarboxylating NADP(+)-dependent phosphogluconate dehydrogenase [Bacteroidota bacterium]
MIYYIMGVSGSGKTTIGKSLSEKLNIPFFDADDFHSEANVAKMAAGQALNDDDRIGWLNSLNNKAVAQINCNEGAIIACSALKEKYRDILSDGIENEIHWVHLEGDFELIFERMKQRINHYMPANLLKSQFESLEKPDYGIHISINQSPEDILSEILKEIQPKKEFGLIGLGVMGKSLARNLASKGFKLALYNRFVKGAEEKVAEKFITEFEELESCSGFESLSEFVDSLEKPRKIFLMVNAGKVTDMVIKELGEILAAEDIIIDGGNSHYSDTERRIEQLQEKGIDFVGTGVSGGEEGALKGPSIMPGGSKLAYQKIEPYLTAIAAKDKNGLPCCTYIGAQGAGHFVKMVHNGIEYAEMQLLAEIYALMRYGNQMTPFEISEELASWNQTELGSYLLEITSKILAKKEGEGYLIDQILDKAGNKGTGSWTTITMAEAGIPATLISASLFARFVSSFRDKRTKYTELFDFESTTEININLLDLKRGYGLARLVNHQQGFELILEISKQHTWDINLQELSRIWTNGCIIRSVLMENFFESTIDKKDKNILKSELESLRNIGATAIQIGISAPCLLAAVDFLNAHLFNFPTANIIQAQRDFFGAHTYQRIDDASGKNYHTIWE